MIKTFKSLLGLPQKEEFRPAKRTQRTNSLRGNFITKFMHPVEDDYDVDSTKPLGTGAFGVVVSGVNRVSSRTFAMKFINKFSHLTRIEREIKLMTDIDHANVIRLFSVYDSDSQVCFPYLAVDMYVSTCNIHFFFFLSFFNICIILLSAIFSGRWHS
jgi:hypothetical protein